MFFVLKFELLAQCITRELCSTGLSSIPAVIAGLLSGSILAKVMNSYPLFLRFIADLSGYTLEVTCYCN